MATAKDTESATSYQLLSMIEDRYSLQDFMDTILGYLHQFLDGALSFVKLLQNREVGWLTIDRRTGALKREQQPLLKKIKLLLLFNPLTEWIDRTHLFRLHTHKSNWFAEREEIAPQSHKQIKGFIDFYNINMAHFTPSDPEQYTTFQSFFVRRHAQGARPVYEPKDPTKAVISSDSRVVVFPTVEKTRKLWVKGNQFTIGNLIQDDDRAEAWDNGAIVCFRLSPQDYHRYHSPVSGKVKWFKQIPGDYFQVDPVALHSSVNILTENARCAVCIESKEFGEVLFVAVGATDVGTVDFNDKTMTVGEHINKGEELGLFQFGGSTIMVAFEQGRIKFDADLERWSHDQIMVDVEVGMSMGTAVRSNEKQ